MIQRGDVCWADLGPVSGSGPAKRRPVLLVQSDRYTASSLATVVVVVLTANTYLTEHPGNVFLPASSTGLPRDSVADVTQLLTLDKIELDRPVGQVEGRLMQDIDDGLRLVLGL